MDETTLANLRVTVRQALNQGKSIEEIKESLRNAGYTEEEIEEILKGIWSYGSVPEKPAPVEPTVAASGGINPIMILGVIIVIAIIGAVVMMGGGGPEPTREAPEPIRPDAGAQVPDGEQVIVPPEQPEVEQPGSTPSGDEPWRDDAPPMGPIPAECADRELKEGCMENVAVKEGDVNICTAFLNPDSWRDFDLSQATMEKTYRDYYSQCVEEVALELRDTSICKEVVGRFFFSECIGNIVDKTQDPDDCELLRYSDGTYAECLITIAVNTKNPSLCEDVKGLTMLSWEACHSQIASFYKDESYCDPLKESSMYDACLASA